MNNLVLQSKQPENPFHLPVPFDDDIWNVYELDYYMESEKEQKEAWDKLMAPFSGCFDSTICNNLTVREELKYFFWKRIEAGTITLTTFARYYLDGVRLICKYINEHHPVGSTTDISIDDFKTYIISSGRKAVVNCGTYIVGMKRVPLGRHCKGVTILQAIKISVYEYYNMQKPLWERDVWHGRELYPNVTKHCNLVFYDIPQPAIRETLKTYMKFRYNSMSLVALVKVLKYYKEFAQWLDVNFPDVKHFNQVNRDILEKYFEYLRVESGVSQHYANNGLMYLHTLFDYGLLNELEEFPQTELFTRDDYRNRQRRHSRYYTDEELDIIFNEIVPHLPKVYGRIFYVLLLTGARINELLNLKKSCIVKVNDENCMAVYMAKKKQYNYIPLDEEAYAVIRRELKFSIKHPKAEYLFLYKGRRIIYHNFMEDIKEAIVDNNILGVDGEIFHFRTHGFRGTKATKLVNMGEDPKVAANMLGQTTLAAFSSYAAPTPQVLKESMSEYLTMQSVLIKNIGKIDSLVIEDFENAQKLCNGYCCRPQEFTVCEKFEACLSCSQFRPAPQYLLLYKTQLAEAEAGLKVATENGWDKLADKYGQQIKSLKNIIQRLEERKNEQKS